MSDTSRKIPQALNLAYGVKQIPIATPDMTEDELRDVVVAFMKLQITFAYTPRFPDRKSYSYYIKNITKHYGFESSKIVFEEGKYYGGTPYMGNAAGCLYRWLPFYDAETGEMDWSPILRTRRLNWKHKDTVYPDVASAVFGNSCSSTCFWSWARITGHMGSTWSYDWIPANGFLPVGDYALTPEGTHGPQTKQLCDENGKEVMFKAYAKTKRADGFVRTGHAVLSVVDPVVVYNEDGSINGEKSHVFIAEQKADFLTDAPDKGGVDLASPLNDQGDTYRIMGNYWGTKVNGGAGVNMEWSFDHLFEKGFLPFTVPELCGKVPVEAPEITFSYAGTTISPEVLRAQTITANYYISDTHLSVFDSNGREAYNAMHAPAVTDRFAKELYTGIYAKMTTSPAQLKQVALEDALLDNVIYEEKDAIWQQLQQYADGNHTLKISCRLSNGQLLAVYEGTLTK